MPLLVVEDMENALRGFDPCTCPMRNASCWRVLTLCCIDAEVGAGGSWELQGWWVSRKGLEKRQLLLGCPRKLGSMVRIRVSSPTYKWDILGLQPTDPNHLLTSWDIQVWNLKMPPWRKGKQIYKLRNHHFLGSTCSLLSEGVCLHFCERTWPFWDGEFPWPELKGESWPSTIGEFKRWCEPITWSLFCFLVTFLRIPTMGFIFAFGRWVSNIWEANPRYFSQNGP